jgi:hypothetical protein
MLLSSCSELLDLPIFNPTTGPDSCICWLQYIGDVMPIVKPAPKIVPYKITQVRTEHWNLCICVYVHVHVNVYMYAYM